MSVEDIELIRKRSPTGDEGPWVTDWNEMAKKTVFRRLSKTLPISPEIKDALEHDSEAFTEQERFAAARAATATVAAAPRLPRTSRLTRVEPDNEQAEDSAHQDGAEQKEAAEDSPLPAAPQPPSLVDQVAELLAAGEYDNHELLVVLREVKLIGASVESLEQCPRRALQSVVEDWVNCQERMNAKRGQK